MADITVAEPFPIFAVANKYILYDINTVTYIRRVHHICGVLIGNIPQAAQQNVFSGIPLELIPEEARLLVERGSAYIVDDVASHRRGLTDLSAAERIAFVSVLEKQGLEAALAQKRKADKKREKHFEKAGGKARKRGPDREDTELESASASYAVSRAASVVPNDSDVQPLCITPTTSYPPLSAPKPTTALLPPASPSYDLFAHLHSKDYFLSPGLRFGCQYLAYPGDPLRFHSHFLANGVAWDQEISLLNIVAGGRLGTGVKKGYLVGGKDDSRDEVRVFCFEWAAM
ncbi:SEN34 subunit of tRNA-splicing endonuclease [Trichodelitschia bisporula]|uniref:tRNA-splicing endonuclease subunit Sen34 n=1 Tax=Trichodelitschia bisporula TaxID=703511 RepID=A0A6G1IA59_9PEZI|nr:SEN34 subunit of tRNA-splicing endonuclease [Trichodelitschia bisporula]